MKKMDHWNIKEFQSHLQTRGQCSVSEVPNLRSKHQSLHTSVSYHHNGRSHLPDITYASDLERSVYTGLNRMNDSNVTQTQTRFDYPLSSPGIASKNKTKMADSLSTLLYGIDGSLSQDKTSFPSEPTQGADLILPIIDKYFQPLSSETVSFAREQFSCEKDISRNVAEAAFTKQHETLNLQEECTPRAKQIGGENLQSGCSQQEDNVGLQTAKVGNRFSSNLCPNQKANSEVLQGVASDLIKKSKDAKKASPEVPAAGSKAKKERVGTGKRKSYDWDILRKEVRCNHGDKERDQNAKDSIDWETIRQANVKEISDTIRERRMNNILAQWINEFLNRLVRDHGSIDLEWLRYVDPDKAK